MNFCFPKPAESWPEHFSLLAQCTTHIMPSQFVSSGAVIASCGSEKPLHGALDSRHKAPKTDTADVSYTKAATRTALSTALR